jgi:hypothetical protein
MTASKGGIKYEDAISMTRREAREMSLALAIAHGAEINWDRGEVRPPRSDAPSGPPLRDSRFNR